MNNDAVQQEIDRKTREEYRKTGIRPQGYDSNWNKQDLTQKEIDDYNRYGLTPERYSTTKAYKQALNKVQQPKVKKPIPDFFDK